ncbi:helix-turn-helix domain-containing protein [Nocardia sp. BMG51109]|uniref:AraC family transcriptional regulator n=1 Tax=Nocardia sp. BMG51109 TaxID=1056816 RepID=UPI000464EC1B|nr:helix-turn-helix domain-containing protein [Nocardia sp. BMG51109]
MSAYSAAVGSVAPGRSGEPRIDAEPHPSLRPMLAERYHGYSDAEWPQVHGSVPAGIAVRLVVKLVDSARRPPEFLIGPRDHHLPIDGACAPAYIELVLDPIGACTLLDTPGSELIGRLADLSDVIGRRYCDVADRMRERSSWRDRFDLLDRFLLDRADTGRRPPPEVRRAWSLLTGTGGAIPIGRIAEDVGWSHRHLIAQFGHHVGVTPKVAAQLVRYDRIRRNLTATPHARLTDLALAHGYADQAHFTREFRRFTGVTPTDYRRNKQRSAVDRNTTGHPSVREPAVLTEEET